MQDVLTTAYTAAGQPTTPHDFAGDCARCGQPSQTLTLATGRKVVSEQFTGYDGWHHPGGRGLCPPCTWSLTEPRLRQQAHQVSRPTPTFRFLTRTDLDQILAAPITPTTALVVPLRAGRKYLLPEATWGHITTDHAQLPWTAADVDRLIALRRLRAAGFGSRMLTADAPPWPVFHRLPTQQWPPVLHDWDLLKSWRASRLWLEVAIHATTATRSAA